MREYTNKKAQELFRKSVELRNKAKKVQDDDGLIDLLTWEADYLKDEADNIEDGIIAKEDYDR